MQQIFLHIFFSYKRVKKLWFLWFCGCKAYKWLYDATFCNHTTTTISFYNHNFLPPLFKLLIRYSVTTCIGFTDLPLNCCKRSFAPLFGLIGGLEKAVGD